MANRAAPPAAPQIHPGTTVGTVSLTVSDLARSRDFYERVLGLEVTELETGGLGFGVGEEPPLVTLHGDSSAPELDRRATGLFHLAILFPTRRDLAFALARLADAGWPLDGVADHLVSEALYLSDPDGNGIELYRDRPRAEWRHSEDQLEMATLPLDLQDVLGELAGESELQRRAPAGTTMGHVHLQVAELHETAAFYHELLGFDVTVRSFPGALFVSAGGYHHHLGLNTWHSAGGSPPAPGSVGLRHYEVILPDAPELERVLGRLRATGVEIDRHLDAARVRDPSGIAVLFRAR